MKRVLATLPLLAAVAVVGYSSMHAPDQRQAVFAPQAVGAVLPAQALPEGHPPLEPWMLVLPEGHPPLLQVNPHLPEGHPPIPGYAGDCPRFRGGMEGNTDQPVAESQELIST